MMRRRTLLLLLWLISAGCTCAPEVRTRRAHLVTVPATFNPRSFVMSDDGDSYAYVSREKDKVYVMHDGQPGPPFLEVTQPYMAPATRQLFYWGSEVDGGQPNVSLVAGGKVIATPLAQAGHVVFSATGGHWAAVGGTRRRSGGAVERGPVLVYHDGREVGSYPDATLPALSRDGNHVALLVENAAGKIALVVDGTEQRTFPAPTADASPLMRRDSIGPTLLGMAVTYLADGSVMQLTRDQDGWTIYQGEKRLASYPVNVNRAHGVTLEGEDLRRAVASDVIATAKSAPVAAWWERLASVARVPGADAAAPQEYWRVVRNAAPVDDIVCVKPWESEAPVLSADGEHIAYACHGLARDNTGVAHVVVDGRRYGPYLGVWGVTLSPDGNHVAYAVDDDAPDRPWRYYIDGRPRPTRYDRAWPPRYSDDGRLLFWVAQRGQRFVLVVNGSGRASSDSVLWVPKLTPAGNLWWVVQRGRRISRVDIDIR